MIIRLIRNEPCRYFGQNSQGVEVGEPAELCWVNGLIGRFVVGATEATGEHATGQVGR